MQQRLGRPSINPERFFLGDIYKGEATAACRAAVLYRTPHVCRRPIARPNLIVARIIYDFEDYSIYGRKSLEPVPSPAALSGVEFVCTEGECRRSRSERADPKDKRQLWCRLIVCHRTESGTPPHRRQSLLVMLDGKG